MPSAKLDPLQQIDAICDEFEDAWAGGALPQIESFLKDVAVDLREQLFGELLDLELELRGANGESPLLSEYLERFPDYESIVRTSFANSSTVAPVEQGEETQVSDKPLGEQRQTDSAGQFGDYEIRAEIARGGMGVVYRALQKKANRVVALKMMLSGSLAGEMERQRFTVEVEAAAALDHPYIVPIYDVGEYQGQPYFTMGFVDGQSLSELLSEGPMSGREAAALMRPICDAIAYAHGRGIVHRDLKPSNILIDGQGRPKVTDFGLAKNVEADQELTATGQVMGTPNYMPPEQARGAHELVGERSDVYALGAVFYCVITGRPPFQGASPIETLRMVLEQEPVAPRELNPAIDADLETIALKCLEKEPARRYESAAAVREEIACYLDGRAISARPISRWEKLWRWSRRHPSESLLGAGLIASLVIGISVSLYLLWLAEDRARTAETKQLMTLQTYEKFVLNVQGKLRRIPEAREIRRDLLAEAMTGLEEISRDLPANDHVRRQRALTLADHAQLLLEAGDEDGSNASREAESLLQEAVAMIDDVAGAGESDKTLLSNRAWAHGELGSFYINQNQLSRAKPYLEESLSIRKQLWEEAPNDPQARWNYASILGDWGDYLSFSRQFQAGARTYQQAIELLEPLRPSMREQPNVLDLLFLTHMKLGDAYHDMGQLDAAREAYQVNLELAVEIPESGLVGRSTEDILSEVYERLGLHALDTGELAEAAELFEKMTEMLLIASEKDPMSRSIKEGLVYGYRNLNDVYTRLGQMEEAQAARAKISEAQAILAK